MNRFDELEATLIQMEGWEEKPYKCTEGKTTIGVGRNLDDKGLKKDEIIYLLKNDIDECYFQLSNELDFFKNLDDTRQDVLINMCFQLGFNGLSKFKRTLQFIKNGDYEKASLEMLDSKWARQTPKRAKTLSNLMKGEKIKCG